MPRTIDDNYDEDEDDWAPEDDEDAEENWTEPEEDDDDTIPCTHCGKSVYEGAEQCPHCGTYLSEEDAPREVKPRWIVLGSIACILMVILWIWKG